MRLRYNIELWLFVQTASAFPDLAGTRFAGLAAVLYGTLFLAAVVFSALRDRNLSMLGGSPFLSLCVGGVTACGTVSLSIFLYRLSPVVQTLSDELAPRLVDGASKSELILVSVFSGVGEEAFFRGALQPELGLVATSVLFGALHVVPKRRFFVWTLLSVGAGFLFGFLYERRKSFGPDDGSRSAQCRNTFALEAFPPGTVSCARRGHGGKLRGARGRMITLPNTDSKGADRRWWLYVLVAVVLVALALGV